MIETQPLELLTWAGQSEQSENCTTDVESLLWLPVPLLTLAAQSTALSIYGAISSNCYSLIAALRGRTGRKYGRCRHNHHHHHHHHHHPHPAHQHHHHHHRHRYHHHHHHDHIIVIIIIIAPILDFDRLCGSSEHHNPTSANFKRFKVTCQQMNDYFGGASIRVGLRSRTCHASPLLQRAPGFDAGSFFQNLPPCSRFLILPRARSHIRSSLLQHFARSSRVWGA